MVQMSGLEPKIVQVIHPGHLGLHVATMWMGMGGVVWIQNRKHHALPELDICFQSKY